MDLRCRKTGCKYNKELTCTAPSIRISKKLDCMEYENERNKEIKDFSKLIFSDTPPKIADYRHLKNMCLHCEANCLFNNAGLCISNGITINAATSNTPKCITFMKP